jgi:hypothetical protein
LIQDLRADIKAVKGETRVTISKGVALVDMPQKALEHPGIAPVKLMLPHAGGHHGIGEGVIV